MKFTYTIQVCNESRELFSLLNFLKKTIDEEDEIHVVADSNRVTSRVESVLEHFKDSITVFKRPFDNFCANSQFHSEKANGEYIFGLDADEIPHEFLIKNVKRIIEEFIKDHGLIDQNFRCVYTKKCDYIKWTEEMHPKLTGTDKIIGLQPQPSLTLWHKLI